MRTKAGSRALPGGLMDGDHFLGRFCVTNEMWQRLGGGHEQWSPDPARSFSVKSQRDKTIAGRAIKVGV